MRNFFTYRHTTETLAIAEYSDEQQTERHCEWNEKKRKIYVLSNLSGKLNFFVTITLYVIIPSFACNRLPFPIASISYGRHPCMAVTVDRNSK